MDAAATGDWVKWVLAAFATAFGAAIGHLHWRLNSVETSRFAAAEVRRAEIEAEHARQWAALDAQRNDFQAFRGLMLSQAITKEDLRDLERRILAAIDSRVPRN